MKHVRMTNRGGYRYPAFDHIPDVPCITTSLFCAGLCPRHEPDLWAGHMAKHVAGESL